jgi:hypothetical protein
MELRHSDHTVLARGDLRHREIATVAFLSHIESKATGPRALPLPRCYFVRFTR